MNILNALCCCCFYKEKSLDPSFKERIFELKEIRKQALSSNSQKSRVAILGAGPAGLIRCIQSLLQGNQTKVFEKRPESSIGRSNSVALEEKTIDELKKYGVYQYLMENGLIFDPNGCGYISVRLGDLEEAMKAVVKELTSDQVINYDSTVDKIITNSPKAALVLKNNADFGVVRDIDILVNAEGSRSSTNDLLHIRRIEVLPKVPVIAAIFKDDRPQITGGITLLKYVGKTLLNVAVTIYYYVIYFFKFVIQGERFANSDRKIAGALILTTPGQNYLGFGFSKEKGDQLMDLKQEMDKKDELLTKAKEEKAPKERIEALEEEFEDAEKEYNSFVNHWTQVSFCKANMIALFRKLLDRSGTNFFNTAHYKPLDSFSVVEIGADRAEKCSQKIGETAYLLAGDALATVDPTTGLGCNTAIQSSNFFDDFISGMGNRENQDHLLAAYNAKSEARIETIHRESRFMRRLYRPDAL